MSRTRVNVLEDCAAILARLLLVSAVASGTVSTRADCQRSATNAASSAEDAFGTRIEDESVGLYSPYNVRGFSPVDAGNVRLEGLYFDQASNPTDRLISQSTVHVGPSAQGYPFPAPTGIGDYTLRKPGRDVRVSPFLVGGLRSGAELDLDAQAPLGPTLGIGAGFGLHRDRLGYGGTQKTFSSAVILRWRPSPAIEILPFWSRIHYSASEPEPVIVPAEPAALPDLRGIDYLAPTYAKNRGSNYDLGLVGHVKSEGWAFDLGVFRSTWRQDKGFADLLLNARRDGSADETIIAFPQTHQGSVSGEIRGTRSVRDGRRTHVFTVGLQGRIRTRRVGGESLVELGPTIIAHREPREEPAFDFTEQTRERIRQLSLGVAYRMDWQGIGQVGVGLRHVSYEKQSKPPRDVKSISRDSPWLLNGTASADLGPRLVIYSGYTQGLEEGPAAPAIAVNRTEAPKAVRTSQVEAGLRLLLSGQLKMIAGLFQLSKPYYGLDSANRFARLGRLRNRGLEISLTGQPLRDTRIVAGLVYLGEQLSTPEGLTKPVGSVRLNAIANVDHDAGSRTIFLALNASSGAFVREKSPRSAPILLINAGIRQHLRIAGAKATAKISATNIFDTYRFTVNSDGSFSRVEPRRLTLSLAADF